MTARGSLAGLLALALGIGSLSAAESPKAPAPPPAAKPAEPAQPPAPAPEETEAARRERLGKLYQSAEALYGQGRYREAQKLYAQIALEEPNYARVGARLDGIRKRLAEEDRRAREAQIERLLEVADAHFAAGRFEPAARACEAVLAIEPAHREAQRKLAECAGELDLRRRVTSIIAEPGAAAPERRVLAQAKTALAEPPGPAPAPAAPPEGAAPVVRSAKDLAPPPAPAKATHVVRPGENIEIIEADAPAAAPAPAARDDDPEGRRLIKEAWDLCESAKLATDPSPVLHKALDTLAPITAISKHSERNKQTAAMLRTSISRRLAEGGRALSPEEAKRARLYQCYLQAEDLFRKRHYEECSQLTDQILAEDKTFTLARQLNQEARVRTQEEKMRDKDLEHRLAFDRRMAEVEDMSVPNDPATPVERPPIDLTRPTFEITSPELEEKLNQRVSVNLIDADLDYFLDLLFRSTGVNIIYNPEVVQGKTITVHITNYPLRQLLDYIAKNHGLSFTTTRDGVLITTPDQPLLESFIIALNYGLIDVDEPAPSGPVAQQGGAAPPLPPPASSNLEKLVGQLPQLCDWPQGSFTYLERKMNLLYVRTTRDTYREVVRLLDPVDQIPIQVLIKTLFMEISLDDFDTLGVQLELKAKDINLGHLGNATTKLLQGKILQFGGDQISQDANTNATLRLAGVYKGAEFDFILDALQRSSKARTLSAPNVICVNNSTATISVTKTLVYIEDYEVDRADISGTSYGSNPYYYQQQQVVPGQTAQTPYYPPLSSEPIITPVFAEDEYTGFTLDVYVSVGKDTRYVTLTLNPRIREEAGDRLKFDLYLPATGGVQPTTGTPTGTTPGVVGAVANAVTGTDNNVSSGLQRVQIERPIIDERSLSTKLTVADGSVVALGGLIQQKRAEATSKVPILGDIPILGYFFSNRSYRDTKTNLLIFVQAELITPTGARYNDSGHIDEAAGAAQGEHIAVHEGAAPVVAPAPLP